MLSCERSIAWHILQVLLSPCWKACHVLLEGLACIAGDAVINGLSIQGDMAAIRQDLGVCPQFDILWPDITVREHLMLYAAIKGFTRQQQEEEATNAAHDVGRQPCHPLYTFMPTGTDVFI